MHLRKVTICGFKSFVESADFLIEPGLTGVVGPNGCGKSNLVEALRWAMGESSARMLRGEEMDDVIFAGSAERSARPYAEVILSLDNSERTAPSPFNDAETLEISRRIDRGRGSIYRINGREVRARDVQLLFADQVSGARSAALVTQGQVASLIAAKPVDRRALLEEAAGIGGLQTRRNEADQRLRAAETNLQRVEDVLVTLEVQQQALEKQMRQAARYRTVSEAIRTTEATVLWMRWQEAQQAAETAAETQRQAETQVAAHTSDASATMLERSAAGEALPSLRSADADSAQALHRLDVEREALEAEERSLEKERASCRQRLDLLEKDHSHAGHLIKDAEANLSRLSAERHRIKAAQQGEDERIETAAAELADIDVRIGDQESALLALSETTAAAEARRLDLERTLGNLNRQRDRLRARQDDIARRQSQIEAELRTCEDAALADGVLAEKARELEVTRQQAETAELHRAQTVTEFAQATEDSRSAESERARIEAEHQALHQLLAGEDVDDPVLDTVTVEPGYETALAAALGEDLLAPCDKDAPASWRRMPAPQAWPPLPGSVRPLAERCTNTDVLARSLSQVGIVEDVETGERMHDQLSPGQRLVTCDGAVWRWDGLVSTADRTPSISVRLQHRRRLQELTPLLSAARQRHDAMSRRLSEVQEAEASARAAEDRAHKAVRAAAAAHDHARGQALKAREKQTTLATQADLWRENAASVARELAETEEQVDVAARELAALPDCTRDRNTLGTLRNDLNTLRARQGQQRTVVDGLRRDAAARRRRLEAIDGETADWQQRLDNAQHQLAQVVERRTETSEELSRLDERPAALAEKRHHLLDAVERAAARHKDSADALAQAETRLRDADLASRKAESELAQARENRIRADAAIEQAETARKLIADRIEERLQMSPDELAPLAQSDAKKDVEALERRLERLKRERDLMGPVNLRAQDEAEALHTQLSDLTSQKEDLLGAIAKLRRGITEINREAEARLLAAFTEVDRHFQELFTRLFGGGETRLTLTTPEDPLSSGLEIVSRPPGKKPSSLSLLSGGEQALTALALRFALFLTNQAPICVLDEVDAPLDDANVDRYCTLLEQMAEHGTRFVVITHHRMTMARMDRLYGVTMSERGVSQLVSVDLRRAEALREPSAGVEPQVFALSSGD
ncbi:MAG: chromosome segregation protein SMC [Hyphomicrobiales bacterium]|nr:chromosome segregation protein SMC [Hyphomicrobiales bacterium]